MRRQIDAQMAVKRGHEILWVDRSLGGIGGARGQLRRKSSSGRDRGLRGLPDFRCPFFLAVFGCLVSLSGADDGGLPSPRGRGLRSGTHEARVPGGQGSASQKGERRE
jgi:hypothetical protein